MVAISQVPFKLSTYSEPRYFTDTEELRNWLKDESGFWNQELDKCKNILVEEMRRSLGERVNKIEKVLEEVDQAGEDQLQPSESLMEGPLERLQNVMQRADEVYCLSRDDPFLATIITHFENDRISADATAGALWARTQPRSQFPERGRTAVVKGIAILSVYQIGLLDNDNVQGLDQIINSRLQDIRDKTQEAAQTLAETNRKFEEAVEYADKTAKEIDDKKAEIESSYEEYIKAVEERLEAFKQRYYKELATEAPANYWKKAAKAYATRSYVYFASFCGSIGAFVAYLLTMVSVVSDRLAGMVYADPEFLFIGVTFLGLPSALFIWILRILIKGYFANNVHAVDAEQRHMEVMTYRAMLAEEQELSQEERAVMLEAIFRPPMGAQHDDAAPTKILENVLKTQNRADN